MDNRLRNKKGGGREGGRGALKQSSGPITRAEAMVMSSPSNKNIKTLK